MKILNRHIHLDFHTSGLIKNVAEKFSPEEFVSTLARAQVGGICLFSRCHHGYCYYPTRTGTIHPDLKRPDLLGEMLKACRGAGIQTGIYTTICWDELAAQTHPEWIARTVDNKQMKMDPLTGKEMGAFEPGWRFLCWNSPYRDYFKMHMAEILDLYTADFLFIDILFHHSPCVCSHCVNRMKSRGLNPEIFRDRELNSIESAREFMADVNSLIFSKNLHISPFYNSRLRITGELARGSMPELQYLSLLGIESLPSGPWGYDHFPLFAKYFQNGGLPCLGYTGKFQKMWGDFGGLKNQAALDYECIRMLANGVAVCVGDQLHPSGKLDTATYELIGNSFSKIKPVEELLLSSQPIDEIGVFLTNAPKAAGNFGNDLDSETGAMKMLSQLHYQFSFVDENSDLLKYKLLILPDYVRLNRNHQAALETFLRGGGKVIASYRSILDDSDQVAMPGLKLCCAGDSEFTPFYFYPVDPSLKSLISDTDHVHYLAGLDVSFAGENMRSFCNISEPYFNRTWDHFCSHLQTPPAARTYKPFMLYNGQNTIYFAGEIFTCYQRFSSKVLKQLVDAAARILLGSKLVESTLPSTAEVTYRTTADGRPVLTVLHYIHQRRAQNIDIVEDVIPLYNQKISLKCESNYNKVNDHIAGCGLNSKRIKDRLEFELPIINGFTVLTLE